MNLLSLTSTLTPKICSLDFLDGSGKISLHHTWIFFLEEGRDDHLQTQPAYIKQEEIG
jgi:hypothetical protein